MRELFLKYRPYILIGIAVIILIMTFFTIRNCKKQTDIDDHTEEIAISQKSYDSVLQINTSLQDTIKASNKRFDSAIHVIDVLNAKRILINHTTKNEIKATDTFGSNQIIGYWTEQSKSPD